MRFIFRSGAILRLIFLVDIFLINRYEDYLLPKTDSNLFEGLQLDIDLPWYIYVAALLWFFSLIINSSIALLFSFKPCLAITKFFARKPISIFVYLIELIVFIILSLRVVEVLNNAFVPKDYGIIGRLLDPIINKTDAGNMHLIKKMNALNDIVLLFASFLFVVSFWKTRRSNIVKCPQISEAQ